MITALFCFHRFASSRLFSSSTFTAKCSLEASTGTLQTVHSSLVLCARLARLTLISRSESLRTYFEQYGKVTQSTIMRDAESGRSRGFAFLTYESPASVTEVLSKEHYLDGKIVSSHHETTLSVLLRIADSGRTTD